MEPIFTRAKVSHLKSKEVGRHDRDREELEGGQVGCGVDEPLPAHLKRVKRVGINKITINSNFRALFLFLSS